MSEGYPRRKHPRLTGYDYSRNGAYFLTLCSKGRKKCFGTVGRDDHGAPWVRLSPVGEIVQKWISTIPRAYPNLVLEQFVIMPDHIHLLVRIETAGSGAPWSSRPTGTGVVGESGIPEASRSAQMIPRMVAALKRFTNREAGEPLWQASYHDHIIRDDNDFLEHWTYLVNNPARWTEDEFYQ